MIVDRRGDVVLRLKGQCPQALHPQLYKILYILSSAKVLTDVINAGVTFTTALGGYYAVLLGAHGNIDIRLHFECINDSIDADRMSVI